MSTLPAANPTFPRAPLLVIGATLMAVLVAVAGVRLSGMNISEPDAAAVQTRALRFEDRPDGSIAVIDGRSGQVVHSVVGESGFVRGTLRGMARDRKRAGGGPEQAFELVARADGRFTLQDPFTGRRVDLESFGPVNAAGFVALMQDDTGGRPAPAKAN